MLANQIYNMRLYHGTSSKNLDSIRKHGVKMTGREVWPDHSVCALNTLDKAREVAGYFGKDGIVLELEVPDSELQFHPDYGGSPEFDTIHIMMDVPPSMIVSMTPAPSGLEDPRPTNMSLRQWKTKNQGNPDFNKKIDNLLNNL
jgi:RNA:NAD 2'-phosphotransferase (TPT1/KptA family)